MKAQALVARNIRRLRVGLGLSQEALAVDAGIDRTYVSRLERGLENPSVAVLLIEHRHAAAFLCGRKCAEQERLSSHRWLCVGGEHRKTAGSDG